MDQPAKSWLWGRQIRREVSMRAAQPFGEGSAWLYIEAFIYGTKHLTEPGLSGKEQKTPNENKRKFLLTCKAWDHCGAPRDRNSGSWGEGGFLNGGVIDIRQDHSSLYGPALYFSGHQG